jgi:hypothetical protein
LFAQDDGEVVKAGSGLRVHGTVGSLENPERALDVGACPSEVSSIPKRAAKIAESELHFWVLSVKDTLSDSQGALMGGSRLGQITQLPEHMAKMSQGDSHIGMIRP